MHSSPLAVVAVLLFRACGGDRIEDFEELNLHGTAVQILLGESMTHTIDGWGRPVWWYRDGARVVACSAGPDGVRGTHDDICVPEGPR